MVWLEGVTVERRRPEEVVCTTMVLKCVSLALIIAVYVSWCVKYGYRVCVRAFMCLGC